MFCLFQTDIFFLIVIAFKFSPHINQIFSVLLITSMYFVLTLLLCLATIKIGLYSFHQFEKENLHLTNRLDLNLKLAEGSHVMSNVFVHLGRLCNRTDFNNRDQS